VFGVFDAGDEELGAPVGSDLISYSDDDIKIIEINASAELSLSFGLNYPEFPDGCLWFQFTLGINVFGVFVNCANVFLEQFGQ
jgi:hypothetical protein